MYTIIDFETTGLDYQSEQVTEIAAIKLDKDFNQIGVYQTIVKLQPGRELSDYIKNLTGLTKEFLSSGVTERKGLAMLDKFIGQDTVIAHFASFDLGYLSKRLVPDSFICTRTMAQLLFPGEKSGLADITDKYGIALTNHHRALADVEATAEIFKLMKPELDAAGIEYLNVMTERADRKLRYVPLKAKVIEM